ncbi:MAG TPA: hypothetical protein ENF55_05360 [Thermoprotei archaeon]|nr:MAG: hypothetical protein DRJ63_03520 [Thermoprotei archaeon]HDI75367.1 hypothetical protein [Thermoprotei archaeon]
MYVELPGELGSLIHLILTAALAVIYAKNRSIVILPALMLASLIGIMVGLEVHPFIIGISNFAAALIVFIAGLELDPTFIRKNKERALFIFVFEAVQILSFYYILANIFPLEVATALVAIMVASNEAFALELKRYSGGQLAQFGITLSVFEDALAVFLLSIGFFRSPRTLHLGLLETIVVTSLFLIPLIYLVSSLYAKMLNSLERKDAKILLAILYLVILIAIAEALGIPEAIPVFIGAVSLSFHGFDRETFNAMESYFVLALTGFVSSLPYAVNKATNTPLTPETFIQAAVLGLFLAVVAYCLRLFIVFTASIMGGLSVGDALSLATALANTGEFGLIVLSTLVITTGLVSSSIAYAALFAYTFNLTLVSEVVKRLSKIKRKVIRLMKPRLYNFLERIGEEADTVVETLARDVELKESILEITITVVLVYLVAGLSNIHRGPISDYVFILFLFAAFIVATQEVFQILSSALSRIGSSKTFFAFFFRLMILYIVIAPLLHFINYFYTEGRIRDLVHPIDSPISLLVIIFLTIIIKNLAEKTARLTVSQPFETLRPREETSRKSSE